MQVDAEHYNFIFKITITINFIVIIIDIINIIDIIIIIIIIIIDIIIIILIINNDIYNHYFYVDVNDKLQT